MDPITAVGFAASILTFIDFSSSLIRGSYEIYTSPSGTTNDNAHIGTVLDDLIEVSKGLDRDVVGRSKHEKELAKLASKCLGVSESLRKILEKLKVKEKNSKWQSMKATWAGMRKEKSIAALEKRLTEYRSEMILRVNLMLCDNHSLVKTQLDEIQGEGRKYATINAGQMADLMNHLREATSNLQSSSKDANRAKTSSDIEQQQMLIDIRTSLSTLHSLSETMPRQNAILRRLYYGSMYLRDDSVADAAEGTFNWMLPDIDGSDLSSESSDSWSENSDPESNGQDGADQESIDPRIEPDDENFADDTIHSTRRGPSPHMDTEGHSIPATSRDHLAENSLEEDVVDEEDDSEANEGGSDAVQSSSASDSIEEEDGASDLGSYQSSIDADTRDMRARVSETLISFLRHENGTFFISGKAGSGKSTLMKHLANQTRLRNELAIWAEDKTLIVSKHFFWNSGDRLQMSLEGFFRSVLFEVLKQCPELCQHLFPDQHQANLKNGFGDEGDFRSSELKEAFERLSQGSTFSNHRFCFLVDGLDEFEGESSEHFDLAHLLRDWAKSADVKIVVSARPHTAFIDTFRDDRVVHLHELTHNDIYLFARKSFQKALEPPRFDRVRDGCREWPSRIREKAEGVFFWAYLVIRSLLSGLAHDDSIEELSERLESESPDLNSVITKMLDDGDPTAQRKSRQMLLLVAHNTAGYPVNAICFSWLRRLDDPDFPANCAFEEYSESRIKDIHNSTRRQIDSGTKGLLEMKVWDIDRAFSRFTIQPFHRAVRDFVIQQWQWRDVWNDATKADIFVRLLLAEIKFSPDTISIYWAPRAHGLSDYILSASRKYGVPPLHRWLDELGRNVEHIYGMYLKKLSPQTTLTGNEGYPRKWFHGRVCIFENEARRPYFLEYITDARRLHICYAASWPGNHQYVIAKISEGAEIARLDDVHLDVFLSAICGLNPPLLEYFLANGRSPNDMVPVTMGRLLASASPIFVSAWVVFLRHTISYLLGTGGTGYRLNQFRKMYAQCFQQFIQHGADQDVVVVFKPTGRKQLEPADKGALESTTGTDCGKQESGALYYLELDQLLEYVFLFNEDLRWKLSRKKDATRLPIWGQMVHLASRFNVLTRGNTDFRSRYKPVVDVQWFKDTKFVVHGVVSKYEEFIGDCYIRHY